MSGGILGGFLSALGGGMKTYGEETLKDQRIKDEQEYNDKRAVALAKLQHSLGIELADRNALNARTNAAYSQKLEDNSAKTKATINANNATIRESDAKVKLTELQMKNLENGLDKDGKPINPKKVKERFTDQATGNQYVMYEDGTQEQLTVDKVVPGRGTPFKEGYSATVVKEPMKGKIENDRSAGDRDYTTAYTKYITDFSSIPMNTSKQPMSYEQFIAMFTKGGSSQPTGNTPAIDPVGSFLSGRNAPR